MTEEQKRTQATLIALGVRLETGTVVESLAGSKATLACAYTGRNREVEAAGVVMVTSREPRSITRSMSGSRSSRSAIAARR